MCFTGVNLKWPIGVSFDGIYNNAGRIDLKGESLRKKWNKKEPTNID
jgi:hypothetical protein